MRRVHSPDMTRDITAALICTASAVAIAYAYLAAKRRRAPPYQQPPPPPPPSVEVVTDGARAEEVLRSWLREIRAGRLPAAIGLDAEWVASRPPALLQLSTERSCVLLRLCQLVADGPPSPSLLSLLEDPCILKAGVGVTHDLARLDAQLGCHARGGIELASLAGLDGYGLRRLTAELLGEELDKAVEVRCSDWEAAQLSAAQVRYAAQDAHVATRLLRALHARQPHGRKRACFHEWIAATLRSPPPLPSKGAKHGGAAAATSGGSSLGGAAAAAAAHAGASNGDGANGKAAKGPSTRLKSRATPLYDAVMMHAPDGTSMCRLSRARADWYVSRGLARRAEDGGSAITLLFQPNGLGNAQEPWLLAPKANACVGCGVAQEAAAEGLMRWSVVPPSFRSLLPEERKSRDSHDIVLVCLACHDRLERPYAQHRTALLAAHRISADTARVYDDATLVRLRSAARALRGKAAVRLPAARRAELEAAVSAHYGVPPPPSTELLATAADVEVRVEVAGWVAPEARLMEGLLALPDDEERSAALHGLQVAYRRTFVDALSPQHLPEGWDVEHTPFEHAPFAKYLREVARAST